MRRRYLLEAAGAAVLVVVLLVAGAHFPPDSYRAVDGDTIVNTITGERIRLENVDSAELHARCPAELELAQRAKAATADLLTRGVILHRIGRDDKYGRTLALVEIRGVGDLGQYLIAHGLGREYHGGHREGWCP
jgi:micrococcal nuclease